ncbi:hypothetical protein [Aestuariibacter sp. A3R04]|uniref:hypothetical protein n=1 Tax=Aestuariibacter sp. A3R04 TaxID=2841571 RepID=UPI001C0963B2|nr:hypothetical protein [Aestuariibacter sp. A3R04]MBU3021865.1 hypothetical protein [Aestuariibacter sp. A3R04]
MPAQPTVRTYRTMLRATSGFSLPLLLIGSAIGVAMLAGASTVIAHTLVSHKQLLNSMYLDVELTKLSALITNRVSKSGWHGKAKSQYLSKAVIPNDFANQFSIGHHPKEVKNSCILFASDLNDNGTPDVGSPEERMGFRLRKKALEMRLSGKPCNANGWQDITADTRLEIDDLTFQAMPHGQFTLIQVSISAHAKPFRHLKRNVSFSLVVNHEI